MADHGEKSQHVPKVVSPPPHCDYPQTCRYRDTPWWKTTAEVIGIGAVVAYTIFSGYQMHYARKQAGAAIVASQAATDTLKTMKEQFQMDQRPHIAALSYVVFDTVTKKAGPPVIGHPFGITVTLKNVGKSTALHLYIHRHLLFGKQYPMAKVEPPDAKKVNAVLEAESQTFTTAVSVKDTYAIESVYIPPDSLLAWDGTSPIVVFGRVTYEDAFGKLYCTPFAAAYLNAQTWSNLGEFAQGKSVSELCPVGTP